jgi:AcrR family transcriptional regulator
MSLLDKRKGRTYLAPKKVTHRLVTFLGGPVEELGDDMPKPTLQKRDAERTKEKLITCAEQFFVKKGYHAVGVDEIAAAARVNKRMIYAYFGSKRKLYDELISRIFSRIDALDFGRIEKISDYREKLASMLNLYFSFLNDNPNFVRLLSWEKLYVDKESIQYLVAQVNRVLRNLFELLKQGEEQGEIRPDVDIRYLASNINSLFIGFFSNKVLSEEVWGESFTAEQNNEKIINNMICLVLDGALAS